MSKIAQTFEFEVDQPSIVWRSDIILETPTLRFPLDEVRFCPQVYLLNGFSAGITLYWNTIAGASFYVLQISDNQSFSGPNIRGIKTVDTEFELNYLEHLRVGDQFFWRVAAYNATGGASVMSEVRSIKIACPETQGVSFNNETSSYADIASPQMCDNTGVNIELGGPSWVRKTDSDRTWVLNVNYDCDSFEGHEVRIEDVIWEIRQSAQAPVTVDTDTNDYIKLDIAAYDEEWFEIIAHVIFELVGVGLFECQASKKVLIEGTPVGGGGVGNEWIDFSVYQLCPALPSGSIQAVWAQVTGTSCQTSVNIGDTVLIWDILGCWFNVPIELLSTMKGRADLAAGQGESVIFCAETYDLSGCYWKVSSLCCYEESY